MMKHVYCIISCLVLFAGCNEETIQSIINPDASLKVADGDYVAASECTASSGNSSKFKLSFSGNQVTISNLNYIGTAGCTGTPTEVQVSVDDIEYSGINLGNKASYFTNTSKGIFIPFYVENNELYIGSDVPGSEADVVAALQGFTNDPKANSVRYDKQ